MVAANYEVFDATCKHCGITYQILAGRDDLDSWMNGEGYIQDVLAYLSPAERELLISGTCDNCWKSMFGDDDDDLDDDEE
jgi:hypothetical protein